MPVYLVDLYSSMQVTYKKRRHYQLREPGRILADLIYKSVWGHQAKIRLDHNKEFEIIRQGFFRTRILVTHQQSDWARLKQNWRGHFHIAFQDGRAFHLRAVSGFRLKYIFEDAQKTELFRVNARFSWKTWHYNFDISYNERPADPLLVMLSIYGANYIISQHAAAG